MNHFWSRGSRLLFITCCGGQTRHKNYTRVRTIKHHGIHTGSIWKCLIFWWWHNVSTNALGLLWLTLSRNNLCSERKEDTVRKKNIQVGLISTRVQWGKIYSCYSKFCKKKCRSKIAPAHLPIHLSLLVDNAVGFFSGYPAMEPQLCYVDDCRGGKKKYILDHNTFLKICHIIYIIPTSLHLPELSEEWCSGLWEPNMFIRWLLFWERCHTETTQQELVHDLVRCLRTGISITLGAEASFFIIQ